MRSGREFDPPKGPLRGRSPKERPEEKWCHNEYDLRQNNTHGNRGENKEVEIADGCDGDPAEEASALAHRLVQNSIIVTSGAHPDTGQSSPAEGARHLPRQAATPGAAQRYYAKQDARRRREAEKVQEMQPLFDSLATVYQAKLIAPAFELNPTRWATNLRAFLKREGANSFGILVDLVSRLHVNDDLSARVRKVQGAKIYVQRWELLCDAVSAMRRQQKGVG